MTEIIAEISGNHNGKLVDALHLIEAAKDAGCDSVKFQLYRPEDMPADGGDYERYAVPDQWLRELFGHAGDLEMELFASVFAPWAVDALEDYGCTAYKIASPESTRLATATYYALVDKIVDSGKRMLISSGKVDMEFMRLFGPDVLFYCRSDHPTVLGVDDLVYMAQLKFNNRNCLVGFSDHTVGIIDTLAMIGAGAEVIEKHLKLNEDCIDAASSITPLEMKMLCEIAHQ